MSQLFLTQAAVTGLDADPIMLAAAHARAEVVGASVTLLQGTHRAAAASGYQLRCGRCPCRSVRRRGYRRRSPRDRPCAAARGPSGPRRAQAVERGGYEHGGRVASEAMATVNATSSCRSVDSPLHRSLPERPADRAKQVTVSKLIGRTDIEECHGSAVLRWRWRKIVSHRVRADDPRTPPYRSRRARTAP